MPGGTKLYFVFCLSLDTLRHLRKGQKFRYDILGKFSAKLSVCCYLQSSQVDISKVSDFNKMYELYGARPLRRHLSHLPDPCTVMFFFRNKHIMIDLGTGNNNKINVCVIYCFQL